ncbi:MAG TPA: hypothetical protein VGL51_04890 [Solirubrobacteraceae bacterium]
MKARIPSPSLALSIVALLVALSGGSYAAAAALTTKQQIKQVVANSTAGNSKRLGGHKLKYFLPAQNEGTSHGVHFLAAGQTAVLGKVGHFTFSSTCSKDSGGQNQVTFDVRANTTADLDGGGPVSAGSKVNIHTDSDALNTTTDAPLKPGDFTQVGSASSSTEIAADGQEVDVFYNDGVNWPSGNGSSAHDCFAGYTGLLG